MVMKMESKKQNNKCYECDEGTLEKKDVEYRKYGILIGMYTAEVCQKCNSIFFESKAVAEIEAKVKKMGLWGLRNRSKVGTSGNALDIKLFKRLVDFMKLHKGQDIEIQPVNKQKFEVNII